MTIRIRSLRQLAILFVILHTFAATAWAQSAVPLESQDRLRVGLVLGGGGARGAAHIGVLKELERLQIPVDAIAGTSMGAIVGGLYATGMNATDLEALVSSLDWTAALTDTPDRADMSFRRKQDDRAFPIDFELGIRGSELLLPKGVIQGQKLDLLLRELTLDVSHIRDFDDLPIPFRAIAADIVAGEAVVLGDGDLAQAIRASMSVPGVFAPAHIGERLLVDGGLVGNLPVDVMRTMGVDVVIAVDVEFPLYDADELESVLAISEQMLTILIRKETLRQIDSMHDSDVLVRPDLGTYASTNFADIVAAIEPGQAATRTQQARLRELSLGDREWRAHIAKRSRDAQPDAKLAFVRVVHEGKLSSRVLESRLSVAAGDAIDARVLANNANRLYGLQLYEQVGYTLVEENGQTGVEYRATSKSWGPNFLQFGISLEDDLEGSTSFNLAARMTRAGINRLGAEWRTDVQLGTDPTLFTEFYQPLSFDSRFFVAPHIQTGQSNLNVFDSDERVARYRLTENMLGLDIGRELGTVGELRVGAFRGNGSARVNVGDPSFPNNRFHRGGVFARLRFDTQDSARFARSGSLVDIRWNKSLSGIGADFDSERVQADVAQTWSRGKNSLQLGLSYGTTLSSLNNVQDYLPLGGFLRLSGLERGEISGPHSGLARLVYYRRVGETTGGLFETPIYFGFSAEAGNVWQSRSDISFDSMQANGSIFAGVDSIFGPVFLAAGYAESGQTNFYLFIGEPPR